MTGLEQSLAEAVGDISAGAEDAGTDLLSRVTDLYLLSENRRTESDTDAFGTVLEKLAFASDEKTRAHLAGKLSLSADSPRRLMRRLAFDDIMVARPVLQYSPCLNTNDLVTLAKKLDQEHLLAIAHRLRLRPLVTDILVDRGNRLVHITVAQNSSAEFSKEGIARLIEYSEKEPELKFVLGLRPDIGANLFLRFKSFVTGQLFVEEEIAPPVKPAGGAPVEAAAETAEPPPPAEENTADDDEEDGPPPIHDPIRDSYASEKNLIKLAKNRLVHESVTCLSKLTGLESNVIEHCMFEAELSALMVLCKANGFANTTFSELLRLRDSTQEDEGADKIDIVSMLKRYEAMQSHTAKRIIQFAHKKK